MKIAIAEDNDFLAKSIKEKLSLFPDKFDILFRARNGKEIVDYVLQYKNLDAILMDIEMPQMDGIKATELINSVLPEIKIIILTVFDDDEKIFSAIKAGASGYLLKDEPVEKIVEGIEMVFSGGAPMSASIAAKTLSMLKNAQNVIQISEQSNYNLTSREIEILEYLKLGYDYNKTAEKLFISPFTVRKHIENIYRKLQVNNKIQAVQKAIQNQIIK
ncbi:MAG: response regulator transcription factor [Ignavibacterium sp.]|jgi:DNA-binding NarL/FixJ family response regulator|uniref:response regulator transcription factor n=1 Tax=Ignavibacterium sp. TaxID=2651167 RepID=UPI0021FDE4A1|nr:response regulator transcription factor [Ignavibacterium sp.]BDQ02330.1 MAG: DNA-binding response regulator [Ignavibacterium sp.]